MTYTIGRGAANQICIPNPDVSEKHAILEPYSKTEFWLEDKSANGTYVNEIRIVKILIKRGDKVVLSNQVDITQKLIPFFDKLVDAPAPPRIIKGEAFKQEMLRLRGVFEDFEARKRKIREEQRYRLQVLKPALTALIGGTILGTCYLLGLPTNIMFLVSGIGAIIAFFVIKDHSDDKNIQLEHDKQMKYICPSCERPLGSVIPDALERTGHCPHFKL